MSFSLNDAQLDALLEQLPALAGRQRRLEDLPGGLTNRNVRSPRPMPSKWRGARTPRRVPHRQQRGQHRAGQGPHRPQRPRRDAGAARRRDLVAGGVRRDGPPVPGPAGHPTDADLRDAAFPFGTSRRISLGYSTVRATRLTYVGELGWELYVPVEFAVGVYEDLMTAGAEFGVARGGYYAIESLRLEKGYRAFGRELTPR